MKLFLIHVVYNGTEMCYRDFIHEVKIELLKEKLLNNPPNAEKSICFDNEAAYTSLKQQVARSTRRSVAPVQCSLSVCTLPKNKTQEALISVTSFNISNSIPAIELSYMDVLID